jgi:hypothetical protein
MASKASLLENRMRMFMVQTKWLRRNREGAMKLHTERIRTIKPGVVNNSPFLLRHPLPAKSADLEEGLCYLPLSLFCRLSKVLSFWSSLVACEKIEDS